MPSVGEPRDKSEERIKGYFFNRRTTVSRKKLLTRALPIGIKFELFLLICHKEGIINQKCLSSAIN